MAQELLASFSDLLAEVSLKPDSTGGVFTIQLNQQVIWERKEKGFPQIAELKRLIRDQLEPSRDLGHLDN